MENSDFEEDDNALWKTVASDFAPLKKKESRKTLKETQPEKDSITVAIIPPEVKVAEVVVAPVIPVQIQLSVNKNDSEFLEAGDMSRVDGSIAQKLREGSYPIDARLDLHGRTEEEAFEVLRYFIATVYSMGKRCILVITGKGVQGQGILRQSLPKWLSIAGISEYILSFTQAKPTHGGDGAFYVLIKKNKNY